MEKRRIAVVAVLITIVSFIIVLNAVSTPYSKPETQKIKEQSYSKTNHFSVRWMGFFGGYSTQYPEYYICINDLKENNLTIYIALRIKNQEDQGYHFKIEQNATPPAGWVLPSQYIGYVDVDETKDFVYTCYRERPTNIPDGRLTEEISLVVKAFYDCDCSNLYSQDSFSVKFNFIDLSAPVWTVQYCDNFDDGTTQGWTYRCYRYGSIDVSNTYYRSFPYSLRLGATYYSAAFRKTFNVGSGEEAYLIFSIRSDRWAGWGDALRIDFDGETVFRPDVSPENNVWYRVCIPIPVGVETTVDIFAVRGDSTRAYAYLDDVYIIVK